MVRDLSKRNRQPETMDEPDLPPELLVETLDGLSLVNAITLSMRIIWPEVKATIADTPGRPVRILDVACGGGDFLIRLHKRAKRRNLKMELAGCDVSPVAIAHARKSAQAAAADITFFEYDATRDQLPEGYDMILCSLFLHHLDEQQAIAFLQDAARRTRNRVVVHDLVRSRTSFWFARIGTAFLLLNDICRADGERSVEGAFTRIEAEGLARAAQLDDAVVASRLPFRFLMTWVRPEARNQVAGREEAN